MINARRIDVSNVNPRHVEIITKAYRGRLGRDGGHAILMGVDADLIINAAKTFFPLFVHHAEGIDVVTLHDTVRWET